MKKTVLWLSNSLFRIYKYIEILVVVLLIMSAGSCDQKDYQIMEQGLLTGAVTIGPLCPVESDPPDPNCQITEETYKDYPIAVYTSDKKSKLGQIQPNVDGSYSLELPIGSYLVDLEKQHLFGTTLPVNVKIGENETSILNIDIDTGIR